MAEPVINRIFILNGLREAVQALAAPDKVALLTGGSGRLKHESGRRVGWSDYLGYFARISASRFLRYASYSALRAGSDGDP